MNRAVEMLIMILDKIELQGLATLKLTEIRDVLKTRTLSLSQLGNILGELQDEHAWLFDFFNFTFNEIPLKVAQSVGRENLSMGYRSVPGGAMA